MKVKIRLFTCFLFALSASGMLSANTKSIKILKDQLNNESNKINKLAAQINHIDKKISSSNESYVRRIRENELLSRGVEQVKVNLLGSAKNISNEYKYTKLAFDHYLLEATDSLEDDNFYSKKIYMELLHTKLNDLKLAQINSNKLLVSIQTLEQNLTTKRQDEESIYQLIIELENNKKEYSQEYISTLENKNRVQVTLDNLEAKQIAIKKVYKKRKKKQSRKKKILFTMGLPIQNFVKANSKNLGITFQYKEVTSIKAPRSGKIVYAGELASYGKVLIIDHGNDVRSVLLGDITTKVKKGDMVESNQVVGYTISDQGQLKSLYYEIRKKNIAQNTIRWVSKTDKKSIKNLRI